MTSPTEGMRWKVTKAVRASSLPAPARLIMMTLADIADVGTAEIPERFTPSLTVLAKETGLGRSTVASHLATLEREGWIIRTRPETSAALAHGERTKYQLLVPASADAGLVQEMASPDAGPPSPGDGQPSPAPGPTSPAPGHRDRSSYQDQIESDPSLPRKSAATEKRQRGTRIPDDFRVTPEMVTWARENAPHVNGRTETQKFINYWQAKAGKDAVKVKWKATWENWMLTAEERLVARLSPPRPRQTPDLLDDPAVRAAYDELFPIREDVA